MPESSSHTSLFRTHWPIIGTIALFWTIISALFLISSSLNDDRWIYPLDDTYIHMAMAKNLVHHGVWGVTPHGFSSSTSSPVWVVLIALGFTLAGVNEIVPLFLAIIAGTLALIAAYRWISGHVDSKAVRFTILCAVLLVTPFPAVTLSGMEHILHALLTVLFVHRIESYLSHRHSAGIVPLLVIAALLPMVRLEGAFTLLVAAIVLTANKEQRVAAGLIAAGALPVVLYGLWSVGHGWYFLPNSILLKGNIPSADLPAFLQFIELGAMRKIREHAQLLMLIAASLGLLLVSYSRKERLPEVFTYGLLIFAGNVLLHLQFAKTGWLFRYEAYLMMTGIITVALGHHHLARTMPLREMFTRSVPFTMTAVIAVLLMVNIYSGWAFGSMKKTVTATTNIHGQQYPMGLFIRQYYDTGTVVINDIGAVTFLSEARIIDLWGLGEMESAERKMSRRLDQKGIAELAEARGASVAFVYNTLFAVPEQWSEVGAWRITNNYIAGNATVNIYAVHPADRQRVIAQLQEFSPVLPGNVVQSGAYTVEPRRAAGD